MQSQNDERIPDEKFEAFLAALPQVSVDIVPERDGSVLLVRRTKEPTNGEWFWPGTRFCRDEPFD